MADKIEIEKASSAESRMVAATARALAVKLIIGCLEREPQESKAAGLSIAIAQATCILIAKVCNVPLEELHRYLDESWEALAPLFDKEPLPAGCFRGSGGDA